ncbi:hypothetical protein [Roseivirga sp. E12]|uniref:hypothetical protein n=1 Tax=Roseivirga sp. E12 TaxID=2819237 RepID=UPI001ABC4DF9|nr:hypothetical protein [Roseivirga sp. E12]MBO3698912.1 hypothetical protein [Roseivirga sp. E12]
MLSPFEELSAASRIWIYQADRALDQEEQKALLTASEEFLQQWAAHGQALMASATVKHDHFLIIATDEGFNMASGCSIDSSFRFVQEIGSKLGINFFDRANLAFLLDDQVRFINMKDLKSSIELGNVHGTSLFFDNNLTTKLELDKSWIVKAEESWLKRYFQAAKSVL